MDLQTLQKSVDQWINTTGVRYFDIKTNTIILAEEVGEFSRLIARIHGEQSFKVPITEAEGKEKLQDELADILWVISCLANQLDIDLKSAMERNFEKKNRRDATRHLNNEKL
ncbi:MAG TPA: nucleotide pyrophosphohydrolase [Saprospiraceae bacterium]|nr:nucleotide pyrophosphohydrolase [Saprospiraceae bacterium]HPN67884.1 nucleotide pyrophosphohydrolase [Saprospiraceae bacterium]